MAKKVITKLSYLDKDVSKDLQPYILSISYKDRLENFTSEISLNLADKSENYLNKWYPEIEDA